MTDTITNQPICKGAGSGTGVGSRNGHMCHIRARTGVNGQCYTCVIPFRAGYPKVIGCSTLGVPCGISWSSGSYSS